MNGLIRNFNQWKIGWGEEDIDLLNKFIAIKTSIHRVNEKGLFHPFHSKNCQTTNTDKSKHDCLQTKYTHNSESISIRMNLWDATVRPLVSILRTLGFIFSELEILDNGKLSIRLEMEEVIKVFSIQIVDFLFSRVVIEFENSRTWRNDHLLTV